MRYESICTSAADTAAKICPCSATAIEGGDEVLVTFTDGNEAEEPILEVGSTPAYPAKAGEDAGFEADPGEEILFEFDGTAWSASVLEDEGDLVEMDEDELPAFTDEDEEEDEFAIDAEDATEDEDVASDAEDEEDGDAQVFDLTCETAAGTAAKAAATPEGADELDALEEGVLADVLFVNGNTAASTTLNANSLGAKAVSGVASWYAGQTVRMEYDGSQWVVDQAITEQMDESGGVDGL